ncbi:hypothetical protein [Kitasatospora purpeofusca]|uniref:hypothetical protein n=1 Tax=Kitasatospora purpeofusca TaxID=67352 RepID=UPI00365C79BF
MQTVAQALALLPRPQFLRAHYPHMYARRLLQESQLVPWGFVDAARLKLGKAARSNPDVLEHALIDWCKVTGEDVDVVRVMLAEAYLLRHSIDAPPDRRPAF